KTWPRNTTPKRWKNHCRRKSAPWCRASTRVCCVTMTRSRPCATAHAPADPIRRNARTARVSPGGFLLAIKLTAILKCGVHSAPTLGCLRLRIPAWRVHPLATIGAEEAPGGAGTDDHQGAHVHQFRRQLAQGDDAQALGRATDITA